MVTLSLKKPDAAVTEPTVMFGVPLKPVALPVNAPTKPPAAVVIPVILTFAKT